MCRARGGLAAERAELELCIREEQEKERRNFEALQRVREEGFRKVSSSQHRLERSYTLDYRTAVASCA